MYKASPQLRSLTMSFFAQFLLCSLLAFVPAQAFSPTPSPPAQTFPPTPTPPAPPSKCDLSTVCYALDQSGSISLADYAILNNFTVTTAKMLKTTTPTASFAAVRFSGTSSVIQATTADVDGVFVPKVLGASKSGGGTNIFSGVRECFSELQKSPPGDGKLIILITDGQGAFGPNPIPDVRAAGIGVITVGVGSNVNVNFLRQLASAPEFYVPASFNNIVSLSQDIANKACNTTVVVNPTTGSCQQAFDKCQFTFQNTSVLSTFNASGIPDRPFTPLILAKNSTYRVGAVNMNNLVPQFIDDTGAKNITLFAQQPFSPTQFKPYYDNQLGSYIGHETYQGNQSAEAKGRCIRVYFSSYQILNAQGNVVDNANNVPKSSNKCVVFKTAT